IGGTDAGSAAFPLPRGVLTHCRGRQADFTPGLQRVESRLAGLLEIVEQAERLGDAAARGQEAMIAQDHHPPIAEIGDQTLALLVVEREALIIVVGDAIVELEAALVYGN